MYKNAGRPKQSQSRTEHLEVRVESAEKQAFKDAADIAGIPLSSWARERLRMVAIRELESVGRSVPFIKSIGIGEPID